MTAVAEPTTHAPGSPPPAPVPAPSHDARAAIERARIDASTSGPVLFFFSTAITWLFAATWIGFVVSLKQLWPGFLTALPWPLQWLNPLLQQIEPFHTYGKLTTIYDVIMRWGWTSAAGMGVALWLISRLCRVQLAMPGVATFGGILWNFGLTLGLVQILFGEPSGLVGMELPQGAAWTMFAGYALVALSVFAAYIGRRDLPVYISVWYILGAFVWFGLVFATSHILVAIPVKGVLQNVVAAWFTGSLQTFWFTALGLAAAYYLIPKVSNRPVHSYNLASIGFWSLAVFGGLTAMTRLTGGPVPAWLPTLSIAAQIMTIIPLMCVTTNLWFTLRGRYELIYSSPTIRFTYFGCIMFTLGGALSVLGALRGADAYLHFTPWQQGMQFTLHYGFLSMICFGAIYYITPRLVGCEWLSATFIKWHFWGSAYGGAMLASMLLLSGIFMGMGLNDPDGVFTSTIHAGQFFVAGMIIAQALLAAGHGIYSLHFIFMLLRIGQPAGEPTLLGEKH